MRELWEEAVTTPQDSGRARQWAAFGGMAAAVGGGLAFLTREDVDWGLMLFGLAAAGIAYLLLRRVARQQRAGRVSPGLALAIVIGLAALIAISAIVWSKLWGGTA